MLNPKLLTILKVIENVDVNALLQSEPVKAVIKEVNDLFKESPVSTEQTKQETPKPQVDLTDLITTYSKYTYKQFRHTSGKVYTLVEITNMLSSDHVKFPPIAIYYDHVLLTKWSRPLKDFALNFELI